jgi:hypothetical protein
MPIDIFCPPRRAKMAAFLCAAAAVAALVLPGSSHAADIQLTGAGSFRPPTATQLAALPSDVGFSRSDLASGQWSFSVRYDDASPDADPAPQVGRYAQAVRVFRLVVGGTTVDFPVAQAQIVVTDGGGGFPNRESVRVEAQSVLPSGVLRFSWIQVNQQASGTDLRGAAGVLQSDALPAPAMVANLATASPFDRFVTLRIDRSDAQPSSLPLLYLSTSKLAVTAHSATAP